MIYLENTTGVVPTPDDEQTDELTTETASENALAQPEPVRHVLIVTVGAGVGEGTRYDLWPLARENWNFLGSSDGPAAFETEVEQSGQQLGTATMLLEHADDAASLHAYLAKRAESLKTDEELLIVAHRPTEVAARSLTSPGRIWTRKLVHMASLPLYQAVRQFLKHGTPEAFEMLCEGAKLQQPHWTEVAELDHDCGNKLHTLAFALQSWIEQEFDKDYRAEEGGPKELLRRHAEALVEALKSVREKIYEERGDVLSIERAVADVKEEAEAALHKAEEAGHGETRSNELEKVHAGITRIERAWRKIQVLGVNPLK